MLLSLNKCAYLSLSTRSFPVSHLSLTFVGSLFARPQGATVAPYSRRAARAPSIKSQQRDIEDQMSFKANAQGSFVSPFYILRMKQSVWQLLRVSIITGASS